MNRWQRGAAVLGIASGAAFILYEGQWLPAFFIWILVFQARDCCYSGVENWLNIGLNLAVWPAVLGPIIWIGTKWTLRAPNNSN